MKSSSGSYSLSTVDLKKINDRSPASNTPPEDIESRFNEYLTAIIRGGLFSKIQPNVCNILYKKHGYPVKWTSDFLTLRRPISEADSTFKYCLMEAINETNTYELIPYSEVFSDDEIKEYSKFQYEEEPIIKFPISIPCVQVAKDQWIGVVDIHFIMKLKQAQLIRYNENTQRVMKKTTSGGIETYEPFINWSAVEAIELAYERDEFIPNVWTFNIPRDKDIIYEYNPRLGEFIIKKLECFDIVDGYHRYLAASRVYEKTNGNFNYPVELRITEFNEKKAQTFIGQEDKKTKMRKVDSQSMNHYEPGNVLTDAINEESRFRGMIGRNDSLINYSEMAYAFNNYFYNKRKSIPKKQLYEDIDYIVRFYNHLIRLDPTITEDRWDYELTLSSVLLAAYRKENPLQDGEIDLLDNINILYKLQDYLINNIAKIKLNPKSYSSRPLTKDDLDGINTWICKHI